MKSIAIEQATLELCVSNAQQERLMVTRDGAPVALVVGIKGLDSEQVELGSSDEFWKMIKERRARPTITRDELERQLAAMTPDE